MELKKTLAATVAATTLGVGGLALVTAGGATASPAAGPSTPAAPAKSHLGRRALRRRVLRDAIKVSAKTIGIPPKTLVAELKTGKSVAQVATAHGVQPSKVIANLVTAGDKRVDQLVKSHRITAERGAKIKARIPTLAAKFVNHVFKAK
jgi:hypothetical protein